MHLHLRVSALVATAFPLALHADDVLPSVQNTLFTPAPPAGLTQPAAVTATSGYTGAADAAATPRSGTTRLVHAAIGGPVATATAVGHLDSYGDRAGLPLSARSPGSDFDGDGLDLLSEFAFNLDPAVADNRPLSGNAGTPVVGTTTVLNNEFLTVTYLRKPGVVALDYQVQVSLTLTPPWQPALVTEISTTPHGDGSETVTARLVAPATEDETFIRLQTTYSPTP